MDRRTFLKSAGVALAAGGLAGATGDTVRHGSVSARVQPPVGQDGSGSAPGPSPIQLVFKVHIEPFVPSPAPAAGQPPGATGAAGYRRRLSDVVEVERIARQHGAVLSIHANGEFFEYAAEQGDLPILRGWAAAGHHLGIHMHAVGRRGPHDWPALRAAEDPPLTLARPAWQDHVAAARAALPEHPWTAVTRWNFQGAAFEMLMREHGFRILGGGRQEPASDWIGHGPFHPWRPGAAWLEEDLANRRFMIIPHNPQIGKAELHGAPSGRTFQDNRLPHIKVKILQVYLEWLHRARDGDPAAKVWLYGFLTHDNQSPPAIRAEIEALLHWLDGQLISRTTIHDERVARYAGFDRVAEQFWAWEAAHPGVSSFHYRQGDPYPETFAGLARLLAADQSTAVDYDAELDLGADVMAHRLIRYPRQGEGKEQPVYVIWREHDGAMLPDLTGVVGEARSLDPRSGATRNVDPRALAIGEEPLVLLSA